ncbi:MAG: serine/threonine-protein kinase [Labedaea sp.]
MTNDVRVVAGRYRLGARIGSGAMGVVWQAHDERLHRTVAVKQLLLAPELSPAQSEEARLRSMREGRIAARLSHPNAITVYDVAEHDGEPWLIMEFLPSRSLAAVIADQGTVPPEEVARIGAQVANALVAAHAAGIVHRDVKPANVLLGDEGTVKITDFGISRATGDVTVTATGMLAGTPAYLAPEVAKGQEPTASSDVFSLGSTLYTAVEGHSPFGLGENTLALLYAVAAGKITPPRQAGPLTALLMRLLRADPGERMTMTEAREGLTAIANGRPAPMMAGPTELIAPHRLPMPPPHGMSGPMPPPGPPAQGGFEATRLDAHPFAEPVPSGPLLAAPGPRPQALPASRNRNRTVRSVVLTVLAIVAAALVGILVASLLSDGRHSSQPRAADVATNDAPQAQSTARPASSATSRPATTTSTPAGRSAADLESAVRQYYALLPANPDASWRLLTEKAQRRSRSQEAYNRFWAGIRSVQVLSTRAVAGNRVGAVLRYVTVDGRETTENYGFALVEQDGNLLIDNFAGGAER